MSNKIPSELQWADLANRIKGKADSADIPTTAADVGALPDSTLYGATLALTINESTYVVTATLKDQSGNTLGTPQTIDLPLESVVVGGSYDSTNKKVVLTLENGSTVSFSVADLVSGLQSEINSSNKLGADLVDDSSSSHKFVSATQLTKLSSIVTIKSIGANLTLDDNGELSATGAELTPATTSRLGGVKVGSGLSVTGDGTLSADEQVEEFTSTEWNSLWA